MKSKHARRKLEHAIRAEIGKAREQKSEADRLQKDMPALAGRLYEEAEEKETLGALLLERLPTMGSALIRATLAKLETRGSEASRLERELRAMASDQLIRRAMFAVPEIRADMGAHGISPAKLLTTDK